MVPGTGTENNLNESGGGLYFSEDCFAHTLLIVQGHGYGSWPQTLETEPCPGGG